MYGSGDPSHVVSTVTCLLDTLYHSHDVDGDRAKSHSKTASEVMELVQYFEKHLPRKFAGSAVIKAECLKEKADAAYSRFLVSECEQADILIDELDRCLNMVHKAMVGKLDVCREIEEIMTALRLNRLPGSKPEDRVSWIKRSWPTGRSLAAWFQDLLARIDQLALWEAKLELPVILHFTFFNPRVRIGLSLCRLQCSFQLYDVSGIA